MRILILDFPFPPSSNAIRGSFFDRNATSFSKKDGRPLRGKMRHYDTAVYREYKKSCEAWAWENYKALREIIPTIHSTIKDQKTMLRVDSYFGFKHSNIWSADGKLQQVDASNRIKACHDELAKYLTVDDLHFNIGRAEKCWVYDHEPERVILILHFEKIRSLAEIENTLVKSN
jgi:hypothetical protein